MGDVSIFMKTLFNFSNSIIFWCSHLGTQALQANLIISLSDLLTVTAVTIFDFLLFGLYFVFLDINNEK